MILQVEYVADPETGFHVVSEEPAPTAEEEEPLHVLPPQPQASPPLDTKEVAKAKERHRALFAQIAQRHRNGPHLVHQGNRETEAVQQKRKEHSEARAI